MGKPPEFKDFRTTNDGVMVADIGFKKQLMALDPELDVVWDWGSKKWEIWKFPGQGEKKKKRMDHKAYYVMAIQTQDRTFRELGADILLKLQWGDPNRWTAKKLEDYFIQMEENRKRAQARDLANRIGSITIDARDYMRGVLKVQVSKKYQLIQAIGG